ncbi:sigma-70 family RNA polymerase sigma factor [Streptomyces sp. NPDC060184]|uniref:sigma-70 family RNA polymerase sigma factor n=1 Tax=Streptomyces sp. NPDC060184 TaxID=3347064 RepID=UPI00364DF4E7
MRGTLDAVGARAEPRPSGPAPGTTGGSPDRDAFARELYDRHGSDLVRYASRLMRGDWYQAEDIVQEAAARAWHHADNLRSSEEARPWLFRVVRNLAIDHYRARQVRPPELLTGEHPEAPTVDRTEELLTSQMLVQALRDLSPQHAEALLLVHYARFTVADAAQRLGVPPGTVKSRCHYAVRALKSALKNRGVLAPDS